jgi:type IV secretion system protein VirB10
MIEEEGAAERVAGERASLGVRMLSVQSRVSNLLAVGLMSALGLGTLTWYYAHALQRQARAKETAQAASAKRAQGDLPLPSLGRIGAPPLPALFEPVPPDSPAERPPLAARTLEEVPAGAAPPPGGTPAKTPEQIALERELSGAVFESHDALAIPGAVTADGTGLPGAPIAADGAGSLAALLRPTTTAAVRAQMLPAQRLLLPKGSFIDCTLETAIDSTLPGMTTCLMATDVFGVDGKVVLMERGTKLIGETRGQVQQGAARIFVLWTEARTPTGVVVPLDSPGADELGRSGLPGEVNRHFWQRFGAAMLVSVIDGAVQAAAESSRGGSGAVIVNPSGSQDVLTEILKNTINIPPTVLKRNGDRIQVLVARDLDFRSVYELRSVASGR